MNLLAIEKKPRDLRLLGVRLTPISMAELNRVVGLSINHRRRCMILSMNLHGVYMWHHDEDMRNAHWMADYVRIDGMALIILGSLLGYDLGRRQRVTWVDWLAPFICEAEANRWKIFYLGSRPEVVDRLKVLLRKKYPQLVFCCEHGYFDSNAEGRDNQRIMKKIECFRPDVLLVGMGMPKQEKWISANADSLECPVIMSCGACMDYATGVIPTPPRWMGQVGLEWLFRLMSDPIHMWRRYLVEPWFFVCHLTVRWIRGDTEE